MKKGIHPANHRPVIFEDSSSGAKFLIYSTVETEAKSKWEDGKEYPLFQIEISSASHPFFTKANQFIDSEGRVDKFTKKYARKTAEVKETQVKHEEAKKAKTKTPKKK